MRAALSALAVACVLLAVSTAPGIMAASATTSHARDLGAANGGGPVADGVRYAAFAPDAKTTEVIDTQRARRFDVPIPSDCQHRKPSADAGLVAVGAGMLLWQCNGDFPRPRLYDLPTGRTFEPPGVDRLFARLRRDESESLHWEEVGRAWLRGDTCVVEYGCHVYLNWHTGEFRFESSKSHVDADLDRPDLYQSLCAPLHRTSTDHDPYQRPPFIGDTWRSPYLVFPSRGAWFSWRCGSRVPTKILRCPGCPLALTGGYFLYVSNYGGPLGVFARAPRGASWMRVPGLPVRNEQSAVHTRNRVFSLAGARRPWHVYEVAFRMPRRG